MAAGLSPNSSQSDSHVSRAEGWVSVASAWRRNPHLLGRTCPLGDGVGGCSMNGCMRLRARVLDLHVLVCLVRRDAGCRTVLRASHASRPVQTRISDGLWDGATMPTAPFCSATMAPLRMYPGLAPCGHVGKACSDARFARACWAAWIACCRLRSGLQCRHVKEMTRDERLDG